MTAFLDQWWLVAAWAVTVVACIVALLRDLKSNNPQIAGLMKLVWILSVLYSGPLGLWVYYLSGRKQISKDNDARRGWRSVSHCFAGCGAGEVVGVFIALGLLGLGNFGIGTITFALAYAAGYALNAGPLIQEGESVPSALKDAVVTETASITVMELSAISVDLLLGGGAGMGRPLFWSVLALSLSTGYIAAWPVNVLLIKSGVKEGMHDPRDQDDRGRARPRLLSRLISSS